MAAHGRAARAVGALLGGSPASPRGSTCGHDMAVQQRRTRDKAVQGIGYRCASPDRPPRGRHALFTPGEPHDWGWRLFHVGRMDERKGVDTAIEALAHLPAEARLTVLGSGDDRYLAELRALCARLGLEGRVRSTCVTRSELPAAYARADALLFPVRWEEPWGLVPLEAMAIGTPVVATGTGGSGEYLRDGENALVVGRGAGPAELARAVTSWLRPGTASASARGAGPPRPATPSGRTTRPSRRRCDTP